MRKGGNYTFAAGQAPGLAPQAHKMGNCYGQPGENTKNERYEYGKTERLSAQSILSIKPPTLIATPCFTNDSTRIDLAYTALQNRLSSDKVVGHAGISNREFYGRPKKPKKIQNTSPPLILAKNLAPFHYGNVLFKKKLPAKMDNMENGWIPLITIDF